MVPRQGRRKSHRDGLLRASAHPRPYNYEMAGLSGRCRRLLSNHQAVEAGALQLGTGGLALLRARERADAHPVERAHVADHRLVDLGLARRQYARRARACTLAASACASAWVRTMPTWIAERPSGLAAAMAAVCARLAGRCAPRCCSPSRWIWRSRGAARRRGCEAAIDAVVDGGGGRLPAAGLRRGRAAEPAAQTGCDQPPPDWRSASSRLRCRTWSAPSDAEAVRVRAWPRRRPRPAAMRLAAVGQPGLLIGRRSAACSASVRSVSPSPPLSHSALVRSAIACAGFFCWR